MTTDPYHSINGQLKGDSVEHIPLPCHNRLFRSGRGRYKAYALLSNLKIVPIHPWAAAYHPTKFCAKTICNFLTHLYRVKGTFWVTG